MLNINNIINQLKKDKKQFVVRQTLYTKQVITENKTYQYFAGNGLKMSELGFIAKVKKYALSLHKNMYPDIDVTTIPYVNYGFIKENTLYTENLFEIDLNQAFWQFAKRRGYINDILYNEGINKVSKKARLISLGNLAKRTAVMKYNGNEFEQVEFEKSDTENIFFAVSKMTADTMSNLQYFLGIGFLFYWCDAVFVQGEHSVIRVTNYLDSEELPYKIKPLTSLIKEDNIIIVDEPKKGKRKFRFNKPLQKLPINEKKSKIQVLSKNRWNK